MSNKDHLFKPGKQNPMWVPPEKQRSRNIQARFTQAEAKIVIARAEALGITISEYMRQVALGNCQAETKEGTK